MSEPQRPPIHFPASKKKLVLPRTRKAQEDVEPGVASNELSLDKILQKTDPGNRTAGSIAENALSEEIRALDKAAAELASQRRSFAADQAALAERERACREMEMLQAARKRLLDQRHAVLNACTPADTPAQQARLRDLEAMLDRTRAELDAANTALAERDQKIAELLNRISAIEALPDNSADQQAENTDAISHPSLQDQVAFLREREAFIEQSENTLFEKAQHLQEWESRLQQIEHDLDHREGGSPSAKK